MGMERMQCAEEDLRTLKPGSLLDVGCGRGEVLRLAESLGFTVKGVEVVPALIDGERVVEGKAYELPFPDGSYDHVTMFDVMEHLLPEDSERVCKELQRVSRETVVLTVSNVSHIHRGEEMHINRRPYAEWDADFRRWFDGEVEWVSGRNSISDTWRVRFR
jgi:SAM-dependent methyltransferase